MGWWRLIASALRLGLVGFGGGLAVLAMIRREFVERRRVLSGDAFAEVAALSQALPGAVSVNAITMLGTRLAGWWVGVLAGWAFVLPSFLLMLVLAATYPAFRYLPFADSALVGIAAAVVALVVTTAWQLARHGGVRSRFDVAVAVWAFLPAAFHWAGVLEIVLLAGLVGMVAAAIAPRPGAAGALAPPWLAVALLGGASLGTLFALGTVFLRIGAATFGGGLVMIPFIEHEVVLRYGWLDPTTFADAIALGQVTPGPVVISATFIGYRVAGLAGAVVATGAVFLPPGLLAVAAGTAIERFARNERVAAFLAGIRPAVVGLLFSAALSLGRAGLRDVNAWGVALLALIVLVRWRPHPLAVLAGAAALHIALHEGLAALAGAF